MLLLCLCSPSVWAACTSDSDCESGQLCDLGACVTVPGAEEEEEAPLAVPLAPRSITPAEPVPLETAPPPPRRHPGLSYADSAWNVALRNEIEGWILMGLTLYGGVNTVSGIAIADPSWVSLQILGTGGLLTYGVITSWRGSRAGISGLRRLGVPADYTLLADIAWGTYAGTLLAGAAAIVARWMNRSDLATSAAALALLGSMTSMGLMQAESIRQRHHLSKTMDKLDPTRRQVHLTPVLGPLEDGFTVGLVATF